MPEEISQLGNVTILFDPTVIERPETALFQPPPIKGGDVSTAGRGTVFFIKHADRALVLKRYRRGGALSRFVGSSYVYLGLNQTRMVKEFRLLQHLIDLKLPVPKPIAVCITRSGLRYEGSILLDRLPAKQTLAEALGVAALNESVWRAVGECIADHHRAGVFHADLNANNIMLNDDGIFLIDFDKSYLRNPTQKLWRRKNLERLHRSLLKQQSRLPTFYFSEADWRALNEAYEEHFARTSASAD